MQVRWSWSKDGARWAPIQTLAAPTIDKPRINGGFYADNHQVVAYVGTNHRSVEAYVSTDGLRWEDCGPVFTDGGEFVLTESFRPTLKRNMLAMGFRPGAKAVSVRFTTNAPLGPAEVLDIPWPDEGLHGRRMEETTWYQTDDGRIWIFNRDGGLWPKGAGTAAMRLWLGWSDDEARTWHVPVLTDFPDCSAEPFAGRCPNGSFFLINNPNRKPMDRRRMALSVSRDGRIFNRMFILADEPTENKYNGMEPGYQYPHGLVDGNRLLVVYSVNKEDVEVGIIALPLP